MPTILRFAALVALVFLWRLAFHLTLVQSGFLGCLSFTVIALLFQILLELHKIKRTFKAGV